MQNQAPCLSIGSLTSKTGRLFTRLMEQKLKPAGMRAGQIPVFLALGKGEVRTQKVLAELAGIEQPGMATLLARMERDGLIEREPDPDDKRVSQIRLSPVGLTKSQQVIPIMEGASEEAFKGFTPLERDILITLLERMSSSLESCL
ncbi:MULTISPECIES: MarR family winged helix-turn-helix transcriptional regulator [Gluconobacter]|uniref:MarR family transcriptional regulator n=3 Tax=Acetobacteraceae TaxID=433 RepID=A0A1B6VG84_9PROT|nr:MULTISPECIES: MarR family winged helix-turn-helix transcriptional regulator [Gluconobacter]OUJ05247.1 MarR family transcriptional regulator [Gluconobacter sp. DsW_058]MBM3097622.1 winged helix-turn-helix transcriptional regulator [Gluconobacter cerinus]MBS0983984.1 winged helix-turn-helix transcriptional regulator [Gluconobacter cerinus]MBS0995689.1 winged helix-turn-helix transcriptional regulator [Gluconobacter cerinus]MBS1018161.1 winged helix-turn-helix transcriptional regulator [Glucon